eukprot:COSAG02_NODE_6354_length_3628_cov_2295.351374_2_plen_70_part_00
MTVIVESIGGWEIIMSRGRVCGFGFVPPPLATGDKPKAMVGAVHKKQAQYRLHAHAQFMHLGVRDGYEV